MLLRTPKLRFFSPVHLICTWFGAGLSRYIPGTVGSAAALPFAWVIQETFGSVGLLIAAVLVFFMGWAASDRYLERTGGDDPGEIVIDEVAGQFLLLVFLPLTLRGYLVGFILFRLFDILKPWPISWADSKVAKGLGVMLDDIMAGLYPPLIIAFFAMIAYAAGMGNILLPLGEWLSVR